MYSTENIEIFNREYDILLLEYHTLAQTIVIQGQSLPNGRTKEQVLFGVGRRISVLRRAVENIFTTFPPNTTQLLSRDALIDVQINLHAFTMNLYGLFENFAWCFVIYHNLEETIGDRRRISLFHRQTKRYLPERIKIYLETQNFKDWLVYLKSYRDSLAHRIPLYIPPANFTNEHTEMYNRLEEEQMECIRQMANEDNSNLLLERLEEINLELERLGTPSPIFLHSISEDDDTTRPIYIHPQIISDSRAIIEFTTLFLGEWQIA